MKAKIELEEQIGAILHTAPVERNTGIIIGHSRSGRPIEAFRIGVGADNISLIGGCHADEPVGPRLLRHVVAYLLSAPKDHPMIMRYTWWIVPHANPDGEAINRSWYNDDDEVYDCDRYLQNVVREEPGDDMEFGFPRVPKDMGARPENRAIYDWWRKAKRPFRLHASLHGLAVASGAWFLIEKDWWPRCHKLRRKCESRVKEMGYMLHDVDRGGEKGFYRLAEGFCSRPDSRAMRKYFLELGDSQTADKFRPSSMETIRSFGGDALTLVSEIPLFIVPKETSSTDRLKEWKGKIHEWRKRRIGDVPSWAEDFELKPMPLNDQMILQWTFVSAGIATIEGDNYSTYCKC